MNQVTCPHCGKAVSVDEVLSHQIRESLSKEYEAKIKQAQVEAEKTVTEKIRQEFEQENSLRLKSLEEQAKKKDQKLEDFQKQILELLDQKAQMEQDRKEEKLTLARTLDQERKKIQEDAQKQLSDEYHLKELEHQKKITDLQKALEEAKRKADQGSQQLQGEVLELDLEQLLRSTFPHDEISPVGKGVKGGDLIQSVKSPSGSTECGQILWEIKRTRNWTDTWIPKLKSDKRAAKANIAAMITTALPPEASSGLGLKEDIWICSYAFVLPLATLLRKSLLEVAFQKAANAHQGRKADLIYDYITGHQFRQQIEALVEVYKEMHEQVHKERTAFERSWKAREGQLQRLILSTAGVYGSMQGLAGSQALPELKGLSLELEAGE